MASTPGAKLNWCASIRRIKTEKNQRKSRPFVKSTKDRPPKSNNVHLARQECATRRPEYRSRVHRFHHKPDHRMSQSKAPDQSARRLGCCITFVRPSRSRVATRGTCLAFSLQFLERYTPLKITESVVLVILVPAVVSEVEYGLVAIRFNREGDDRARPSRRRTCRRVLAHASPLDMLVGYG
jgi:hypothetical protein